MFAKKSIRLGLVSAVAVLVVGGLVVRHGAQAQSAPSEINRVPVSLAEVKRVPYTYAQLAIGHIEARQQVQVSSEISGKVVSLAFDSGNKVSAGQLLVRLNSAPQEGELIRLKGEMEAAAAQYKRLLDLARSGAESQRALDTAKAQLDSAKGNLETVQAQIAQRNIKAPFAGELGIRLVHLGDYVQAGKAIATLTDLQNPRVNFMVSERDSANLALGQAVSVHVDAWPQLVFDGVISAVDPQVNGSHVINVQAQLADSQEKLRPGMYAKVEVALPPKDELVVPETAITYNAYGESVFTLYRDDAGNERVKRKNIKIGERRDGLAVVSKGLVAGDEVVTSGQLKLQDGVAIQPVADTVGLSAQR
jgi:multidrug efflux system membrane fusion protein